MFDSLQLYLDSLSSQPYLYYPLVGFTALAVGSFLNVLILRTPKMMERECKEACIDFLQEKAPNAALPKALTISTVETGLSLAYPPSTCPRCQTPLKLWHNIPLLSYLLLKGRCGHCQSPISLRYPLIEAATAILSLFTITVFGLSPAGCLGLVLLWVLIALTMIDINTYLLPDSLTLPLLWLGLLVNYFSVYTDLGSALWGAITGYLSLWSVYWLFKLITKKEGMGYGDFKLLAALGAWMGWQLLPLVILLSSLVGAVIGIAGIVILGRDKNIPIPFGPYLAIAGWIAFMWGDSLTTTYLQFLAY